MKKNNKKIEEEIENIHFAGLTPAERERMWNQISARIEHQLTPSPWYLPTNKFKSMVPLMIAAVMFLGVGGTAAVADNSKPGDILFGVDRAVEEMRIAFATKEKSADLKARFSEERLAEVDALITKARVKASIAASASSTASTTAATTATSTATTTASSTPNRTNKDVGRGVSVAIAYLTKVSAELAASGNLEAQARIQAVITKLESMINASDVKVQVRGDEDFRVRVKSDSDDSKMDINTQGNKTKIEVKDDGARIHLIWKDEVKVEDSDNDESEDEDNDDDDKESEDEDEDEDEDRSGKKQDILRVEVR